MSVGLLILSCSNSNDEAPALQTLSGEVTISPNTDVKINTKLTAHYDGDEDVSYQWKKDGAVIPGAAASEREYTPDTEGSYKVIVSAVGYHNKESAAVTVNLPSLSREVTITPTSATVGTKLTAHYDGDEDVSYQWNKDGVAIPNATTDEYILATSGSYTVTVSAPGYASKTSTAVTPELSGDVTITPTSAVVDTELTAHYDGEEDVDITYQWKKGSVNVFTGKKYTPDTTGSYKVTASAPGYKSKNSDEFLVTAGIHSHNFTLNGQYQLLGLDRGTDVLWDMNERFVTAQDINGGSFKFYPIIDADDRETKSVNGINLGWCPINEGALGMGFVIDSNDLFICGITDPYTPVGVSYTITFNVAIIASDGKGWLSGQSGVFTTTPTPTNDPAYTRTYTGNVTISDRVSISDLTGGKISTEQQLEDDGYMVYVIVRTISTIASGAELNDNAYNGRNVIQVYPTPYELD